MPDPTEFQLSIIVASDYQAGSDPDWNEVRALLAAISAQRGDIGLEIVLCVAGQEPVPDDITRIPDVRIARSGGTGARTSAQLKLAGARLARASTCGVLDADCLPEPGWVRAAATVFDRHPDAALAGGPSRYPSGSLRDRLLTLLGRADIDPGDDPCDSFPGNNFVIRRECFVACPPPTYPAVFHCLLWAHQIRSAGHRIVFDRDLRVIHALSGWRMEFDIRRNMGHATIAQRRADSSMDHAWMTRLGPLSLPLFLAARTLHEWGVCLRHYRRYQVAACELPLALGLSVLLRLAEFPGMVDALMGRAVPATAFR